MLNWGIISAGLISQDFCTALKTLDSNFHKIKAVGARNINDAKLFAEKYSIENYYDSYEQVFENEKVDIVYVGNVNNKHKEACLKAIQSGKHVLCEKPMTINCFEQEEVLKLAKEKGVFFMEAIWTRFFPLIERLREELRIGTIGEIKLVQANFFVNIKDIERVRSKELGGGGVLDLGIYPIQFACLMFNHEEPIEITASGHLMPSGVDECMNITLKYSNQRIALIGISTNCCPNPHSSAIIGGEKGTLQVRSAFEILFN
jgi:dihydrodiol dehydrogenase / D-xylose 1-dehydrogenase (NADP)